MKAAVTECMNGSDTRMTPTRPTENPLQDACEQMTRLLTDGVKHGFFAMTVEAETVQSKRRRITIRAGKSYQFVVSEEHVRCL
jgi:hypothetical protein